MCLYQQVQCTCCVAQSSRGGTRVLIVQQRQVNVTPLGSLRGRIVHYIFIRDLF